MSVDGQVGPNTKAALYGAVTPPATTPPGGGYSNILSVAAAELGTRRAARGRTATDRPWACPGPPAATPGARPS
ncbi:hypothetical protein ACRAWF_06245 [Streptomyces sp. L7]